MARKLETLRTTKYENLNHINIKGMALVRNDKRERFGLNGTTSTKGDLKQRIACGGNRPIDPTTGRYIAVSVFNKLQREQGV
tara:strand:+ start:1956 stop:2201 length:246 start_codon:yes stop_codon:yes gene_type:complete